MESPIQHKPSDAPPRKELPLSRNENFAWIDPAVQHEHFSRGLPPPAVQIEQWADRASLTSHLPPPRNHLKPTRPGGPAARACFPPRERRACLFQREVTLTGDSEQFPPSTQGSEHRSHHRAGLRHRDSHPSDAYSGEK